MSPRRSDATLVKSWQCDCLHVRWTKQPQQTCVWTGGSPRGLHKVLPATKEPWEWKKWSSLGKSTLIGYPALKAYVQITLFRLSRLYVGICVYRYILHVTTILKRGDEFEESKAVYMGGFGGQKGGVKYCSFSIISKIKEKRLLWEPY